MRILCYGAGAIGSLVGGYLARAGYPAVLLGRDKYVAAIKEKGLLLALPGGSQEVVKVEACTSLAQAVQKAGLPDLIILTVKGYDTRQALADIRENAPRALVLSLQNGLGNEELIADALNPEQVLAGCITLSVTVPQPGCVQLETGGGGIGLAPFAPGTSVEQVAGQLGQAGFLVKTCPDYRSLKWSKLLLNILANASCAILDMSPGEIFSHPAMFKAEQAAFREALRVMKAQGIDVVDLPGFPVGILAFLFRSFPSFLLRPFLGKRLSSGRGDKMPSLWIDLEKERPRLEIDQLNGSVAYRGEQLGIPTPFNTRFCQVLQEILKDRSRREEYRHRPQKLFSFPS